MMKKRNDVFDPSPPEEQIEQIGSVSNPSAMALSRDRNRSSELCPICLDDPIEKSVLVATLEACKHAFCFTCLVQWQRQSAREQDALDTDPETAASQAVNDINAPAQMPQLCRFKRKKYLCCPCCRTETEDLEQCLLQRAQDLCTRAKQRGCPSLLKEQLLQEALEAVSSLLQLQDPELRAYYVTADVQLALGRPQDTVITIQQLMKIDQERHAAIQSHPVLAWIEHARQAYDAADYAQAAMSLKTAVDLSTRIGNPAKPPPALHGSERTRMYQASYLLQGEAYRQLHQWMDALRVHKKLLRAHQETQVNPAKQSDEHDDNDVVVQIWKGLAACLYQLGGYAAAVDAVNRAVLIDRSVAGVSIYKALSLVHLAANSTENADELVEEAVFTMHQALLYEAPWDSATKAANLKVIHSLCLGTTPEKLQHKTGL
jgi:tetratricopeptide (TPR) repeat protein